jgi:hypothetical protein
METKFVLLMVIFVVITESIHCAQYDRQPQHVHLSLGSKPSEMMVTWLTTNATSSSVVEFGSQDTFFALTKRQEGWMEMFTDGGSERRTMHIHRVLLTNLQPGKSYTYHVGSDDFGWSETFWFKTIREGNDWSPRFAVYGDLGVVNGQSIPRLQQEVSRNRFDAILHVGDMAYDLDTVSIFLSEFSFFLVELKNPSIIKIYNISSFFFSRIMLELETSS